MKKFIFITATIIAFPAFVLAQTNVEEIEYFQSLFGGEKKVIVSEFIELDGEAKDAFWALYDEYETERKLLGKNRIALLEKYAENYEGMTDAETDETMAEWMKQKSSLDKLVDQYYKKIRKASGAQPAAQFYHLESYFLSAIRLSVLESIPVIGELGD